MKRFLLPLLATMVLYWGCSSPSETEPEKKGSLVGSVSDVTTGEPVSAVNVTLTPGGKQTVTGTDGNYSFLDLQPGEYSLEVTKDGYRPNYGTVTITSGEIVQKHMLIDRIPAVITADRNLLDFGETLNTLSFTIVNRGYTKMTYRIERGSCSWIKVNPEEDAIQSGETATIVVTIDRSLLASGDNEAMIVVRSLNGGGNTEIKVTAIGEYRAKSAVNTLPATDIANTSAVLNGEITNEGAPKYSERGFVWHTSQQMTLTNCIGSISVAVNDQKSFSCRIENLQSTKTYYARAYCKQNGQTIYGNSVAFSMSSTDTKVETSSATNITSSGATLNGSIHEVGTPAYTERGFCYSDNSYSTPTISDTKITVSGSGQGNFSVRVNNLTYNNRYVFRAYAIQNGVAHYGSTVYFSTGYNPASVVTSSVTNIGYTGATLNGTVADMGDPTITERGFCYTDNAYRAPTISDNRIRANGLAPGAYKADITNLEEDCTYYVRAYVIQDGEPVYGSTTNFHTYYAPILVTGPAKDVKESSIITWQATFYGLIADGNPQVTEFGFVYSSTSSNPTVNNGTKVQGSNTQYLSQYDAYQFSRTVTNLDNFKTYYVRAYAKNSLGYTYGETESFTTY